MPHPDEWEIIVADNGSCDDTAFVLARFAQLLPLKSIYTPLPGKSRSLNSALCLAKGDLILFTDDDIVPQPDWLIRWLDGVSRHQCSRVYGGRILIDPSTVPGWIMDSGNLQEMLLSLHDLGEEDMTYPVNRYPIGPNMAVHRDAIVESGARWPENLGPGTAVPLGDERAFLCQISKPEDTDRLYLASVAVTHQPEAGRLTRVNCWKRCFLGGLATGRIDRNLSSKRMPAGAPLGVRLRNCRSLSELVAMVCRAMGVFAGRLGC